MNLEHKIIKIRDLSFKDSESMLALMQKYFKNVTRERFYMDLKEKDLCILLTHNNEVKGFSTQVFSSLIIEKKEKLILFSGDTVIDSEYRNSFNLFISWGKLVLSTIEKQPDKNFYWILTTKGFRTYRLLSVLFSEYYPAPKINVPNKERIIIEKYCKNKFGNKFISDKLIISADNTGQILRQKDAEITESRKKNINISFFEKVNPGYIKGDELVCIVPLYKKNILPFMLKKCLK